MTPWVTRLILANVVAYFLTIALPGLADLCVLVPVLVPYRPWTLVTYMFLHAGLGHIFFNMLALFFFGPRLEARLGGSRFLQLYFTSGVMGALLSFATPYAAIVGASGAVFGVMLGFARYWPHDRIFIWGIIPVPARMFVLIMTALSLFGTRGVGDQGVAHFAHLGGFLGGWLYLLWMERTSAAARFRAKTALAGARPSAGASSDLARWQQINRDAMHPVNREELDRVMAKIAVQGVGSLQPDERAFLDRFS